MRERCYEIFDVFADRPLVGNPLAVVYDSDGLDSEAMQAIAREFNLSETVFVGEPRDALHAASIRIFTPNFEMPFAGHPTVGSAIALALRNDGEKGDGGTSILVLEEKIGDVRCVVNLDNGAPFAEFDLPQLSQPMELELSPEAIGAALGLDPQDIGFENHRVSAWTAGVPYVAVPVHGLRAAAKVRFNSAAWNAISLDRGNGVPASAYVYCRETIGHDCAFHARMFSGGAGYEDPATGSALAAFSGAVVAFDQPGDGAWQGWIEQGMEMGRPSRLRLEMDIEGGKPAAARIGGNAVRTAAGSLLV